MHGFIILFLSTSAPILGAIQSGQICSMTSMKIVRDILLDLLFVSIKEIPSSLSWRLLMVSSVSQPSVCYYHHHRLAEDVMITEITEAPWYVQNDPRLAAPLIENPFTHGEIGVLMRKGQDDLLVLVNAVIAQMKADGTLRQLHEKYGLVYGYE